MPSPRADRSLENRDVTQLIRLTEDPSADERFWAVTYLGLLRRPHTVAALARVLAEDDDETVRAAAARQLGAVGGDAAQGALLRAESADPMTRAAIADALGVLGDPGGAEKLRGWIDDADAEVREAAARALGRTGGSEAVSVLAGRLRDDSPSVRWVAQRALKEIGEPGAVEALRTNVRRTQTLRLLDAWAASRSVRRNARRSPDAASGPVDRLTTRMCAGVLKFLLMATVLTAVEVSVLGASLVVIAAIALPAGAALGWALVIVLGVDDELDLARARATHLGERSRIARSSSTVLRTLARSPVATTALIAVPVLVDVVAGVPGVAAGLVCAFCVAAVTKLVFEIATVWSWENDSATMLLVERGPRSPQRRSYTAAHSEPG